MVLGKQGDISEGMVVALTRCTDNGNTGFALGKQILDSLCLVVGLLVRLVADNVGKACAVLCREGVSVTDNNIGGISASDKLVCSAIAADHKRALCHNLQCVLGSRVVAIGDDYSLYISVSKHLVFSLILSTFGIRKRQLRHTAHRAQQ